MSAARHLATAAAFLALIAGCGGDERDEAGRPEGQPIVDDPGPIHVHGLGVNPRDGALFIATHSGVFRAEEGEGKASRVAGRYQDTMAFTITGPDRFLASGHPDGREGLPPFLGLIGSSDAAETWQPVSLQGETDFHLLEASGQRVYGFGSDFDSRDEQLLVSSDAGRSWDRRVAPESLIGLAVDPTDPDTAIVAGARALHVSENGGRSWQRRDGRPGLLSWPRRDRLFSIDREGTVRVSRDAGSNWVEAGALRGEPAAFRAESETDLYAALHDGTVLKSSDGGKIWSVRSTP